MRVVGEVAEGAEALGAVAEGAGLVATATEVAGAAAAFAGPVGLAVAGVIGLGIGAYEIYKGFGGSSSESTDTAAQHSQSFLDKLEGWF